jgi:hypothetical protein
MLAAIFNAWVVEELDEARQQYQGERATTVADDDRQPALPSLFGRIAIAQRAEGLISA